MVSISAVYRDNRKAVDIPVVVEIRKGAVQAAEVGGGTMQAMIEKGLRAQLELESLITGQLYVGLDLFPDTPITLAGNVTDYPEIPSIPSLQDDLQQTLNKLVVDAPRLQTGLVQMLDLINAMAAEQHGPGARRRHAVDGAARRHHGRPQGAAACRRWIESRRC